MIKKFKLVKSSGKLRNTRIESMCFMLLAAFLYSFGMQAFVAQAKIFSAGLSSIAFLLTFTVDGLSSQFSLVLLLINIPFLIWSYFYNKKSFTINTIAFIVFNSLFGQIYAIDDVNSFFQTWLVPSQESHESVRDLYWPIIVLTVIGTVISSAGIGLSWKYGGSSGGTDIVVVYIVMKYKKSVGTINKIFGITLMLFSFGITLIVNEEDRHYWLITLFSSFIYVLLLSHNVDKIYPKYKKVSLEIFANDIIPIVSTMRNSQYNHSFRVHDFESGFTQQRNRYIKTTCYLLELKSLMKIISDVDTELWISINEVRNVIGKFEN